MALGNKLYNSLGQKRLKYEGVTEAGGALKSPFSLLNRAPGEFEQSLIDQARGNELSVEGQRRLEETQRGGLSSQQQAEEQLAMRGGFGGGGSRERLLQAGMEQQQLAEQGVRSQDASTRLGLRSRLAGVEAERARSDVDAARQDQGRRQEFGLRQFEKESDVIASDKLAKTQANACFVAGTKIKMSDGTEKEIEKVDIKDELMRGGFVYGCGKAIGTNFFDYEGVIVTGTHAVFEDGIWVRVADSRIAKPLDKEDDIVYMVACENHSHIINGILFSDFDEIDEGHSLSDEERLEIKNKREFLEVV